MFLSPLELLSADEEARLFALTEYDILHSLREAAFNDFVQLAACVFRTPISLIGLVDAELVHYEAAQGVPYLVSQPRQEAICALLVRQNRAIVFTDLTQASQYQQLTAAAYANAQAQQFLFYAGVPLRPANRHAVGTLCVIDRRPRQFNLPEMHVLEQLAKLVERLLIVRHTCLVSQWLGEDAWQNVQAYVSAKLRALNTVACNAYRMRPVTPAVEPSLLWTIVNELNTLDAVLSEPLPGLA